ncbi:MAG: Fic family protein [Candidatus Blackburnbacteria bacterium]|nr:Fic family protein [Candidatus Blackburnbacteria bacterium]
MYSPKYTITNQILKNIATTEACREVIENAPLVPTYERKFKQDAIIRTVHHGTHIEGNDLTFTQAERVLSKFQGETDAGENIKRSGVVARERDVQEVINYRQVMEWLDGQFGRHEKKGEDSIFSYTETQIKQVHKLTVHKIVSMENEGNYRKTQVVLRDSRTGEITFRPPPAVEVPYLMEDLLRWLNSATGRDIHPVLRAGIAHYALAAIHPFVEGNGRTARAFATLILFVERFDIKKLFSLEEYFDREAEAYYKALMLTSDQSRELNDRDLTCWLEYFTHGLSLELGRAKEKIRKLSVDARIKKKHGEQISLSDRQIRIIEYLSENGKAAMSSLRELFPDYSEDTVLRDLQSLVKKGILIRTGHTKGVMYELAT